MSKEKKIKIRSQQGTTKKKIIVFTDLIKLQMNYRLQSD